MTQHPHDHEHQHQEQHQEQHGHGHSHDRPDDFDWGALADSLELDAAITLPIVDQVLRSPVVAGATQFLDVGCGPGVVAVRLALHSPTARVTALDSSEPLLERVRRRATEAGAGARVDTVAGDLDQPLPPTPVADLIWASMVLHHVADPVVTLEHLRNRLAPGGALVMVEFGNSPTVLAPGDPLVVDGTWSRFQAATAAALNERLGFDPVAIDWPDQLQRAGFVDVTDVGMVAEHTSPLSGDALAWLTKHVRNGIEMARDRLSPTDVAALTVLADALPKRHDLFVRAERRVLTARRP